MRRGLPVVDHRRAEPLASVIQRCSALTRMVLTSEAPYFDLT